MKAAICPAFGGPETIKIGDASKPAIGKGEVLVRVMAAGVNYADLLMMLGNYQVKAEPPFAPGMEVAGEVVEIADDVSEFRPGDRVVGHLYYGGYAEYAPVSATHLFALPENVSFETGAATFINYITAYAALFLRTELQKDEHCLVLGGAGGVGLASIALATHAGARVIGAASSAERCSLMAEHGVDDTIDYGSTSLRDRVMEITDGHGADLIIDPVGGDMGALALRCVARGGRIVSVGFAAGIHSYSANILLVKNVAALGMFLDYYMDNHRDLLCEAVAKMYGAMAEGTLRTFHPIEVHKLDDVPDLLERVRSRRLVGKAIVTI